MDFVAGNEQRSLSLWSKCDVISFFSADNRQCEDDGWPLFSRHPRPLPHHHHHHTHAHTHTSCSQEVIGCGDSASTWRATGPSSLFSSSTYLSLFILPCSLPLVADETWRCRGDALPPSLLPSASSPSSPLPPVCFCARVAFFFVLSFLFIFIGSCHCAAVH